MFVGPVTALSSTQSSREGVASGIKPDGNVGLSKDGLAMNSVES